MFHMWHFSWAYVHTGNKYIFFAALLADLVFKIWHIVFAASLDYFLTRISGQFYIQYGFLNYYLKSLRSHTTYFWKHVHWPFPHVHILHWPPAKQDTLVRCTCCANMPCIHSYSSSRASPSVLKDPCEVVFQGRSRQEAGHRCPLLQTSFGLLSLPRPFSSPIFIWSGRRKGAHPAELGLKSGLISSDTPQIFPWPQKGLLVFSCV